MWCWFHLPMTVENEETAKARWGEAEIEAFNDAIFSFIDAAQEEQRDADLSGVVFPGAISFERYVGEANSLPEVLFIGASFSGIARFLGVSFGGDAILDGASFGGDATFEEASFGGDATFEGASFGGIAIFEGASFRARAWFQGTSFGGNTTFEGGSFGGDAILDGASFGGDATFEEASFGGDATFEGASFGGDATFEGASFGGLAWFEDASFGDFAKFDRASFGRLSFRHTGGRDRAGATFSTVSFVGAKFSGEVHFHNRKFLRATDFTRAYFERAPEFHGCTLHQDTFFPEQANFRDRSGAVAALAYRTLKHAMATVHARGEEAKFYVLEQKSLLRDKDTPLSAKFFSVLYWLAADYGQSVLRPLFGVLITFAAFLAIYVAFLLFYLDPPSRFVFSTIDFWDLLRFSLRQVFRPFEVFSLRVAAPAEGVHEVLRMVPLPLALLAALHSVLTLSFVALFLLALRRRFKLD
jgi:uncharacterized protein YjbI with pentapeptide repeats